MVAIFTLSSPHQILYLFAQQQKKPLKNSDKKNLYDKINKQIYKHHLMLENTSTSRYITYIE